MTMKPGSDALIEAGQSDALVEAVHQVLMREIHAGRVVHSRADLRFAARVVVSALRNGGISDLVIRKCLCGDGFTEAGPCQMCIDNEQTPGWYCANCMGPSETPVVVGVDLATGPDKTVCLSCGREVPRNATMCEHCGAED